MEVELVVVRHGETESNRSRIVQGHRDTALSELGLTQAACVGEYLAETTFSLAVSSDLIRALKTGQVIAEANPSINPDAIQTWTGLRERCFGEFEGQDWSKLTEAMKVLDKNQLLEWGPSGGETGQQFKERARTFLKDLCKKSIKIQDSSPVRVLMTSHGGFIKQLNMVMVEDHGCEMPCDNEEYSLISPNTGVTRFSLSLDAEGAITSAKCTLLYYKDHLDKLGV